jgi:hypothetical protein
VSEGDPTDHVLAAIASILDKDKPDSSDRLDAIDGPAGDEPAGSEPAEPDQSELHQAEETLAAPPTAPAAADPDTEGYAKFGPGPLAAIRFKWTARRGDNGDYFVDETIGENSHPIVSGPMTGEAAIKFVDDQEHRSRQRFEALRSEMAGGEIGRRDEQS